MAQNEKRRTQIRPWTHNRHAIPRIHMRAMAYLLCVLWKTIRDILKSWCYIIPPQRTHTHLYINSAIFLIACQRDPFSSFGAKRAAGCRWRLSRNKNEIPHGILGIATMAPIVWKVQFRCDIQTNDDKCVWHFRGILLYFTSRLSVTVLLAGL